MHGHKQAYVGGLSDAKVRSLCTRILCGHGGVGLATSLLQSANEDQGQSQPGSQVTPWCVCGNCRPMGTPTEDVRCHKHPCITRHEKFYFLCINYLVLTVVILGRVDIRADPIDYSPSSYRKSVHIYWVHGYIYSETSNNGLSKRRTTSVRGQIPCPRLLFL